jgi:maleate isomerase
VTPITASLEALERFGVNKLAVLTPYVDDVNKLIAEHLESQGKEVCGFTAFHIEDNEVMAAVPAEAVFQAALEADRPDAEALFISCTAIRAADVVERIEKALGKPVVTANQAMVWQSLRLAGYKGEISGYGSLLKF